MSSNTSCLSQGDKLWSTLPVVQNCVKCRLKSCHFNLCRSFDPADGLWQGPLWSPSVIRCRGDLCHQPADSAFADSPYWMQPQTWDRPQPMCPRPPLRGADTPAAVAAATIATHTRGAQKGNSTLITARNTRIKETINNFSKQLKVYIHVTRH